MLIVEAQVVLCAVVGQVQVVCASRPFSRHCVNLLHHWQDGPIVTQLSDGQLCAVRGKRGFSDRGQTLDKVLLKIKVKFHADNTLIKEKVTIKSK